MPSSTGDRPNIVFIFSDQQHWRALGLADSFFRTPNIDRFAADSVVFDNAFCTCPQCSPSRSSILTGLYPTKTGVLSNPEAVGGEPLRMATIAPLLRAGGYGTAYFGKWHLCGENRATEGWDERFGVADDIEWNAAADRETTARAVDFLRRHGGRDPFVLFLSYNDPHDIYFFDEHVIEGSEGDIGLPPSWHAENRDGKPAIQEQFMREDQGRRISPGHRREWLRYHDCYRAKVALYDAHVGAVLDALAESPAFENTIVIITSDHGDMDCAHRLILKGPFMYDEMVRVPLVIRVPKRFGGAGVGAVSDIETVNVDLAATIMDFCGAGPFECDGFSLRPVLTGRDGQRRREFVVAQYFSKQRWVNPIRMIRTRRFKYNAYSIHGEELYDLENDPREMVNLACEPDHDEICGRLRRELDRWIEENDDPFHSMVSTTRAGTPLDIFRQ